MRLYRADVKKTDEEDKWNNVVYTWPKRNKKEETMGKKNGEEMENLLN